ncbi:MAG: hypothetical protein V4793_18455 [Paraburkholderia tropica]
MTTAIHFSGTRHAGRGLARSSRRLPIATHDTRAPWHRPRIAFYIFLVISTCYGAQANRFATVPVDFFKCLTKNMQIGQKIDEAKASFSFAEDAMKMTRPSVVNSRIARHAGISKQRVCGILSSRQSPHRKSKIR